MKRNFDENQDFYFNENGLMVFTAAYHLSRGYCCGNGCLHCPYHYEAVPEPNKTLLLSLRDKVNTAKNQTTE